MNARNTLAAVFTGAVAALAVGSVALLFPVRTA